ncbi:sigma E protease regulator RseP [Aestuariibacter halophilus]|uniref:Zinc metalloprotease n=1 Tax=Fluctibacter halophilus TaxID=226011 RepID=A0ABS8GDH7_9ALTE|nr:sigma E protease regulator RseP [Aestuariibacter halophilus]MCC2618171.1 sigma E protease regulator RseP [Aestuariibacter halophilus]
MIAFVWNLVSFILALGILVAVHEWGHFWVARRCGVKVERFSIGFGKPLWRRKDALGTEYVIAAIPLGGYVRMLDERVDQVREEDLNQAFNRQPVLKRIAIIAAGPITNFLFAIVALWLMYMIGLDTVKPVVGDVTPRSIAAQSALPVNSEIIAVGDELTADWEAVNLELVSHIGQASLPVTVKTPAGYEDTLTLDISQWQFDPDQQSALASLGIVPFRPQATTTLAYIAEDSAASQADLRIGDKIIAVDGTPLAKWEQIVEYVSSRAGQTVVFTLTRDGQTLERIATIGEREVEGEQQGYLGVVSQAEPWPESYLFTHQYGPFEAMAKGAQKTWRLMTLSVEMIGKLLTGDVSVKNLSGPISIAQGAGISAGYGLVYFLSFLALISVNLGIINLLPLPVLDGGHLLYYFIELLTGKPVPEHVQDVGFRIGGALLLVLMTVAIFNDIARL